MKEYKMKAKIARELLDCTYTTLHNYVKSGKLKLEENAMSKQQEYDDESVYQLMDKMKGKKTFHNKVMLFLNNHRYEFVLDRVIINKILDLINFELKRESLYDDFLNENVKYT